jgi:TldD protein
MPRGLATVKWDDEAVAPTDAMLVENGMLVDYQTTRENASVLASHYTKRGIPVRSNGCAGSETALGVTMARASNIELLPGKTKQTFDDLVAGISRGLALVNMGASPDFQQRTVRGGTLNDSARILEIVNGKPTAIIAGASYLFMASEIWKSLVALGGPSGAMIMAGDQIKGEPDQFTRFSVQAVPGAFKNFPILDASRI